MLHMHNECEDALADAQWRRFHLSYFPPFNKHLQKQQNAGEELWENRQLSSQACNLASIDSALYIPHGHTHTCKRKHPNSPQKSRAHTQTTENLRLFLTRLVCLVFEDRRTPKEEDEERYMHIKRNGLETRLEKKRTEGFARLRKRLKCRQILIKTSYKSESLLRQI